MEKNKTPQDRKTLLQMYNSLLKKHIDKDQ